MRPTPQQLASIAGAKSGQSLAINARAGSGKTSTLRLVGTELRQGGLATSFSKSTVKDLTEAMPRQWQSKGLHALGLASIKASGLSPKVDSSNSTMYDFSKEAVKNEDEPWLLQGPILALCKAAQQAGIMPEHERFLMEDTPENWELIADHYDIEFNEIIYTVARNTLIHINKQAKEGIINFTHMLTLPLFWSLPIKQYKLVLLDEAQDLNSLQHKLVWRLLRNGGQIIMAGDPNQAIYAFAGALPNSYNLLAEQFCCTEYPLTISWRCDAAIIREAQLSVPEIEARPNAPEGEVIWHDYLQVRDLPHTVLCRNNAPLLSTAMRCLAEGISAEVAGRDIGAGLKSLTKRIASGKNSDKMKIESFLDRLRRWREREISRKPRTRQRTEDKFTALSILSEPLSTLGELRKHIDSLFIDPEDGSRRKADVLFSTVHKAKGLEWDDVLILDPHLFGKGAEKDWEIEQDKNLRYVAVTRARHTLRYCNSKNIT